MGRKKKVDTPLIGFEEVQAAIASATVTEIHMPGGPVPAFTDGRAIDFLTFAPGSGVVTIPLPARDFIDLRWPEDAATDVKGRVPRYTIHASTSAEAVTLADEAERHALSHGAYAVGAPIRIVDIKRQARVELTADALQKQGADAVRAWVTRYAEVYPMPEGLTVEGTLAMMGVES